MRKTDARKIEDGLQGARVENFKRAAGTVAQTALDVVGDFAHGADWLGRAPDGTADDDVVSAYDDVKVAVDPASVSLLVGATLDFKDGLQGAGFSIDNPNASRTCGCGNSFS